MENILGIMPISIGGRLTTSSILDGFKQNGYNVFIYDELYENNFQKILNNNYKFIVGYDFSPIKLKIDNNLQMPCIAYFSDVIMSKTSGTEFEKYSKYLSQKDIYVFYWDRVLAKRDNFFYQPHFVNLDIYHNFKKPSVDVTFMGRLDTDLRLDIYLTMNKNLKHRTFKYYGIERHYLDALSRCKNQEEENILKSTYGGFIDNEKDMSRVINNTKIVYNVNAQGVSSLNYRSIQTLACERLLISDEREELDLFDNIIPTYATKKDLINQIEYFLENNEKYNEITKKSREIIELNHDSKLCIKNMLDKIN